jgi:hypothetical protein
MFPPGRDIDRWAVLPQRSGSRNGLNFIGAQAFSCGLIARSKDLKNDRERKNA